MALLFFRRSPILSLSSALFSALYFQLSISKECDSSDQWSHQRLAKIYYGNNISIVIFGGSDER
jgi:hypothetical protein